MSSDLIMVLSLLVVSVAMFAINRPRMDVVALLMIVALPLTGVITVGEALAGFSDPNVVLIAALFVIGEGLVRTGVAQRLGDLLIRRAGGNETRLLVLLMLLVGLIGAVMSSTGVVAIFIPVVLRICQNANIAPGRLMMPLSVAALISGMMTLVATAPNLVVQAELARETGKGFHFFSFTPFGIPLLLLAIGYMLAVRRWLPGDSSLSQAAENHPRMVKWIEEYSLAEREYRFRISPGSELAGQTLEEFGLEMGHGANVIAIERNATMITQMIRPSAETRLEAGDVLFIDRPDPAADLDLLAGRLFLEKLPLSAAYFSDRPHEIGMAEVMISANSKLTGSTILRSHFRSEYDLTVIGLKQGRTTRTRAILEIPLQAGDTLLVVGLWKTIQRLKADMTDLIVFNLPAEIKNVIPAASRAPFALFSLAVVVTLMVSGWVPNVQAALIGCLLLGLFGCINMTQAYRSIHWQSLILIVGMLPFSIALQKTGGVELAANGFLGLVGEAGPRMTLAGIFLITSGLGLFISNTATAVLMAPVAMAVARELNASPYPFAMTVALAASAAFMTPVSSPVNTLVVGPGNYRFMDFVKIGVPLTILALVTAVVLVPWLLPL